VCNAVRNQESKVTGYSATVISAHRVLPQTTEEKNTAAGYSATVISARVVYSVEDIK